MSLKRHNRRLRRIPPTEEVLQVSKMEVTDRPLYLRVTMLRPKPASPSNHRCLPVRKRLRASSIEIGTTRPAKPLSSAPSTAPLKTSNFTPRGTSRREARNTRSYANHACQPAEMRALCSGRMDPATWSRVPRLLSTSAFFPSKRASIFRHSMVRSVHLSLQKTHCPFP